MKIVLSGGGTLGPVTPLLAIAQSYSRVNPEASFVWFGTKNGPERVLVEKYGIEFRVICSGKFRRYASFLNIIDVFKIAIGFCQAIIYLFFRRPALLITAGGYVGVPLHLAAAVLKIPAWVHQQDKRVGLANRIMAPFASIKTTVLNENTKKFKGEVLWLGNPVREEILKGNKERAIRDFKINSGLPVVFALGGGTGSQRINELIVESLPYLKGFCEVIHLTGQKREQAEAQKSDEMFEYYHHFEFFTDEMPDAYAVADIVVARGGFGTISEIASMSKPAIFIPKPGHQCQNVGFLIEHDAGISIDERTADGKLLAEIIKGLLTDEQKRKTIGKNLYSLIPPADEDEIADIIDKLTFKM